MITRTDGIYVDGTLGGGGHAAALLELLDPAGRVIGIDRDADSMTAVSERLPEHVRSGRLVLLRGEFGTIRSLLQEPGLVPIDGLLLDLGVSSHQLDMAARGFSHRAEGPLDMRMDDRDERTAADLVNGLGEYDLKRILRIHGEEPRAHRIAREIIRRRPFVSTTELADVVRQVVPGQDLNKTLARVFQALRIEINAELDELEAVLMASVDLVRTGGRIAVISYHSLEDRRVKRFLRYGNFEGRPDRDFMGRLRHPWAELNRKPIEAEEDEIVRNPRARSARLRLAERIDNPE